MLGTNLETNLGTNLGTIFGTIFFLRNRAPVDHTHHLIQPLFLIAGCARVGEGRCERVEVGDGEQGLRRRRHALRRGR